jgi:hypothetical protein
MALYSRINLLIAALSCLVSNFGSTTKSTSNGSFISPIVYDLKYFSTNNFAAAVFMIIKCPPK